MLSGPNNGGKSTLLSAIRLLDVALATARRRRPTAIRTPTGLREGHRVNTRALTTSVENIHSDLMQVDTWARFAFTDGRQLDLWFPADGGCILLAGGGASLPASPKTFRSLFPVDIVQVPTLGPLENGEPLLRPDTVRAGLQTHRASRHFRNYWNLNRDAFGAFQRAIETTWPSMTILPPERNITQAGVELLMFCEEHRRTRELYWCGFGFQVWCQLVTHIVRAGPGSILVADEPETYLHPRVQHALVAMLRQSGAQVFVASHSASVVASAREGEAVLIDGSAGVCRRMPETGVALSRTLGLLPTGG